MLFYKVPEKKQKDKIFFVCVCTSHVTGKDNAKDFFFLHVLKLYHGKLNNFEEFFYKST